MDDVQAREGTTGNERRKSGSFLSLIDRVALAAAIHLPDVLSRCDNTIIQLPILTSPIALDSLPIWHNGETYQVSITTLAQAVGTVAAFRSAVQASVAADGSTPVLVTYAMPFPTATTAVAPSILNNYQTNPWALTIQYTNPTASGFTVNVAGGPAGSTVSVGYIASGF